MAYYRCDSCEALGRVADPPQYFWCGCGQVLDCAALLPDPSLGEPRGRTQRFRRDTAVAPLRERRTARPSA